jgi:hypothetical protein
MHVVAAGQGGKEKLPCRALAESPGIGHMREQGNKPDNVEVGNAWHDLYKPENDEQRKTNWIIGDRAPETSLRFIRQDKPGAEAQNAKNISLKYFIHKPNDPPGWGERKPTSKGRTISILAGSGVFELTFKNEGAEEYKVLLDQPGDFVIWGDGVEHSWKPISTSTIITMRWVPLAE